MQKTVTRKSSFELLRLILMVMIIVHHCIAHGLMLKELPDYPNAQIFIHDSEMPVFIMLNSLCICAVNCFVLISGYFGIRTSWRKAFFLIFSLLFYTLIFTTLPHLAENDLLDAIRSALFLSHSPYWFAIDYLFLMAFTPMINLAFERMSRRNLYGFVGALTVISIYFGFAWNNNTNLDGVNLFQFILMYSIGRLIHKYDFGLSSTKALSGYLLSSLLCGALMIALWRLDFSDFSWRMTRYNDALIIASAISLFLLFKNFNFYSSKINSVAKYAFGIYLFQSSYIVSKVQYGFIKDVTVYTDTFQWGGCATLIITIIAVSCFVAAIALLFDRIRMSCYNFVACKIWPAAER